MEIQPWITQLEFQSHRTIPLLCSRGNHYLVESLARPLSSPLFVSLALPYYSLLLPYAPLYSLTALARCYGTSVTNAKTLIPR
jgi:hypothetical protein